MKMQLVSFFVRLPFLKRVIPSIQKRIARWRWPDGFVLKRWHGLLLLLNHRNYIDRQIVFLGSFEETQLNFFFLEMKKRKPDLFLDIGANIGCYSLKAAKYSMAKRIVAFEPDERNAVQLKTNCFLNNLTERIEIIQQAVTVKSGTVGFQPFPANSTGQSKIAKDAMQHVQGIALDDWLPTQNQTIFIKMDIEGHELEAFQGMQNLLRNNRCFIQVESFQNNFSALQKELAKDFHHLFSIQDDHYFANFD